MPRLRQPFCKGREQGANLPEGRLSMRGFLPVGACLGRREVDALLSDGRTSKEKKQQQRERRKILDGRGGRPRGPTFRSSCCD